MNIVKIQGPNEMKNNLHYEYDADSTPLGEGGMGKVFQGYCINDNNPNEYFSVAIKVVTNITPALIERARREASIQIDHPNLLRMYGFIPNMEWDAATNSHVTRYYLIMERLVGVNLDNLLGGLTLDNSGIQVDYAKKLYDKYRNDKHNAIKLIVNNVLQGAAALHKSGYIHRDIDPSNVMITEQGNIKLIDFGVSKSLFDNRFQLTTSGSIIGKLEYAAPEIISGKVEQHNVTTDIYAIGIFIYLLVTGSLPFVGDSAQVMQAQIMQPVPIRNIRNLSIRQIVEKATRKAQSERYQSVDELIADWSRVAEDISPITSGKTVVPVKQNSGLPAWLWIFMIIIGLVTGIGLAVIVLGL